MTVPIPLLLLTGYVGAGRSTLMSQWLVHPEFASTAVVANVLDDGSVDGWLSAYSAGTARTIAGGCMCCALQGRLVGELEELFLDRLHRRIPRFERVVVDAAGLADPAALLEELTSSPFVRENYRVEGVVTVIDALEAQRQLDHLREPYAQALVADALVIAKTDLVEPEQLEALEKRLAAANPWAPVIRSANGNVDARRIRDAVFESPGREERMRATTAEHRSRLPGHDTRATVLRPGLSFEAEPMRERIEAFLERHGAKVLRVKGLLALNGQRGPAVIQAVAGFLYPIRLMSKWPTGAQSTLVLVTQGIPEAEVLAALE